MANSVASEKESPYTGFGNNPIFYKDPLGDTTILNGWNNVVNHYNARFNSGLIIRLNDPTLLLQDVQEMASGVNLSVLIFNAICQTNRPMPHCEVNNTHFPVWRPDHLYKHMCLYAREQHFFYYWIGLCPRGHVHNQTKTK